MPTMDSGDSADTDDTADTDTQSLACVTTCDCEGVALCYEGECAVPDAVAVAALRNIVDEMIVGMDPVTGAFATEGGYPSEALATLSSAAELLCDPSYEAAARTRAAYTLSYDNADDLFVWWPGPYISRDMEARQIYNLWTTGHALDDAALLGQADARAEAMIALLAREPYADWTLFCTTYATTAPYACTQAPWIDVNQNSEIGLAFSSLAADPGSALYLDPVAIDIADNELAAAVSLQTPTGEIPIAGSEDYITDYDTLYGSYAAYSWTLSLAARPDDTELAAHVALAAAWLAPYSDATPETHKTYPQPYDGDISVAEGSFRIPLLSHEQVLDPAFVGHWWSLVEDLPGDYYVFIPLSGMRRAGVPLEDLVPRESL